ncbi:hypothetical protein AB0N05_12730 [Nocardia sp. NPDC051030]|uniref:hypothetical protein n=1 Tax=Nocardia sp. NPDC051030 TaxID=3155162 RepID=UPI003438A81B
MTASRFDPHDLEANGLRLELTTRRLAGPLVPGRPPQRWFWFALRVPGLLLVAILLVAPVCWTIWQAWTVRPLLVFGCLLASGCAAVVKLRPGSPRVLVLVAGWAGLGIGLALIVLEVWDTDWVGGYLRTLAWVVFSAVLSGLALIIAWWGKDSRWLWWPLLVPFGISAFVSGIAFRLIFEWIADRMHLGGIVEYRIWFAAMLGSAFLWTWLGVLISLCRAAILAIDADSVRAASVYRDDPEPNMWRHLPRMIPLLRPTLLIFGLVVGVAAARVFDVVLVGVPATLQASADSATVHWWNLATGSSFDNPDASAYALVPAVLIGLLAWALQPDMRRYRRPWLEVRVPHRDSARTRFGPTVVLGTVTVLTFVPIGVLVWVTVRAHRGFDGEAWRWLWGDEALKRSLETTALVAALATIVVVAAAVPVAFRLAALATDRLESAVALPILVVMTVMPAQLYAGPIRAVMDSVGLSGTRIPLIFVHAAAGLPMAILVLRGALLAPPDSPAADALHGLTSSATAARRFIGVAGPALGAVAVLEFIQVWNDFFIGLLVSGAGGSPWSLLLWGEARQFHENAGHLAAGALLSAVVPVAILLLTFRPWLVPGLTGGRAR